MFLLNKKNKSNYFRSGVQYLILGCTVFAYGAMSAAGMYHIIPSLELAFAAFGLGGFMESDVYKQYVVKGSKMLSTNQAKMVYRTRLKALLDNLVLTVHDMNQDIEKLKKSGEQAIENNSGHFRKILQHRRSIEKKRETHEDFLKKLLAENRFFAEYFRLRQLQVGIQSGYFKGDKHAIQNDIAVLLDALWLALKDKHSPSTSDNSKNAIEGDVARFVNLLEQEKTGTSKNWLRNTQRRIMLQYVNLFISAAAVINFYLTALYLSSEFLTVVPFLPTLVVSLVPTTLCVFAALGYGYLVYKCMSDIIASDEFGRFFVERHKQYQRRPQDSRLIWVARIIKTTLTNLLVMTIVITATAATFGAWYYAAREGQAMLTLGRDKLTQAVAAFTTAMASISEFSFSLSAGIEAIKLIPRFQLWQTLKTPFENPKQILYSIKSWWQNHAHETLLQKLNPFRPLAFTIAGAGKGTLFVGHLASVGASVDKMGSFPPLPLAGIQTVNEGMTDIPSLFPVADNTTQLKPFLAVGQKLKPIANLDALKVTADAKQLSEHHGHHHHGQGEDDEGHSHGLMDGLVFLIALPFNGLAFVWDFLTGAKYNFKTLKTAFRKYFPKHDHHHDHEDHNHHGHDHHCDHKHDHNHEPHQAAQPTNSIHPELKRQYNAGQWAQFTLTTRLKTKANDMSRYHQQKKSAINESVKLINEKLSFAEKANSQYQSGERVLQPKKLLPYIQKEKPNIAKQRYRFFDRCRRNKKLTQTENLIAEIERDNPTVKISVARAA